MIALVKSIAEVRQHIDLQKKAGKTIGFVPTMGALHRGHLSLVEKATEETGFVVVSIFVNPIQFNNAEDLDKYPRTLETDLQLLDGTGCQLVFAPSVKEMYPEPDRTEFDFGLLDKVMEGSFRPGHFRGVAVVVKKLFEIVTPEKAYFGLKDFQQLAIVKQMVKLLQMPVVIVPCPIVREDDGLAMSSRNTRLSAEDRSKAPAIFKALSVANTAWKINSPSEVKELIYKMLEQEPLFRVEYVEVVDATSLQPLSAWNNALHAVVCIAVHLGKVRLIDNIQLY